MTPPNPPASQEERVEQTEVERRFIPWFTTWIPSLGKVRLAIHHNLMRALCLLAALEGATILGIMQSSSSPFITPVSIIASSMAVGGALIRQSCYRHLSTLFTFDLAIKRDHRLVTSGPYAYVRHPSYTGAILSGVGASALFLASRGSWMVECSGLFSESAKRWIGPSLGDTGSNLSISNGHFPFFMTLCFVIGGLGLVVLVPRTKKEDEMMKQAFGKEWEEWRTRVRWRLVPGVY
ncbi:hypothetical protein AAF712_001792 [Marasmius tenuissimus]|uniref:Protein-S-isoprenylcysteine O-methyltransferase n=1 Tax=Marasmius tenuissimus TaxID=585030 RepID=A0ABR3AB91_9AGAR